MATCHGQEPYADDIPPTIRLIRVEFLEFPSVPHMCAETLVFSRRKRMYVTNKSALPTTCTKKAV